MQPIAATNAPEGFLVTTSRDGPVVSRYVFGEALWRLHSVTSYRLYEDELLIEIRKTP